MANAPSSINLAAAVQAGVDPAVAQKVAARSPYLAAALQQMAENGGKDIRSPWQLGGNLLAEAIMMHDKRQSDQAVAGIQRQIASQLFPNDPRGQLLYLSSPDDMGKAMAEAYKPMAVKQGEGVGTLSGGFNYTQPVLWHDANLFGTQTPNAISITGQREATIPEQTQQSAQQETGRHNVTMEGIELQKIPIELGMMHAALGNAATNAGNLNLNTTKTPEVSVPPGYVLDGAGR